MKILLRCLLFVSLALHASEVEPLTMGSIGLPMVQVRLTDAHGAQRTCRFLLDTGANITVLDRGLVTAYAVATGVEADVEASTGDTLVTPQLRIRGLGFGSSALANVEAVAMDLAGTFGAMEDGPMDGILGMNVLRGLQFVLDVSAGTIHWDSKRPEALHVVPLRWSADGLASVRLSFPQGKRGLICDTGFSRVLELPEKDLTGLRMVPSVNNQGGRVGVAGVYLPQERFILDGVVTAGSKGWSHPEVGHLPLGQGSDGRLGMGVFQPRVWFDFAHGNLGLPVGQDGRLVLTPALRSPVAVKWVLRGTQRCLVVLAVKPDSPYEQAGLKPGDRLLQVDVLETGALTIRSLRECLERGVPRRILLERDQQRLTLQLEPSVDPSI